MREVGEMEGGHERDRRERRTGRKYVCEREEREGEKSERDRGER